jgi:hypothetical protein
MIAVTCGALVCIPLLVVAFVVGMFYGGRAPTDTAFLFCYCIVVMPVQLFTIWVYTTGKPRWDYETRCRKCGYILRGIREPRCPECGERI